MLLPLDVVGLPFNADPTILERMTLPITSADIELAASLVQSAGQIAAELRTQGLIVEQKTSVSDVVTEADRLAEQHILESLQLHRSSDGVLGEEGSRTVGTSGRTWVIDPVDGTYNFAIGLSNWCCALAIKDDESNLPLLGAVYHVETDSTWIGGSGIPTTRNGQPLEPLVSSPLSQGCMATYLHPPFFDNPELYDPWLRMVQCCSTYRMLGSASMDQVHVAQGRIQLWCQNDLPEWDWMPGYALVSGVHGEASRITMGSHTWRLSGNKESVREALEALTGR